VNGDQSGRFKSHDDISFGQPTTKDAGPEQSGSYGNFQDPFGLIYRMLRTRDRAALSALYHAGLKIPFTALDRLLEPFEAQRLRGSGDTFLPIVLIVGPPRSGTTLVYQVLSQHLPVSYFDNWGAMFPRSTISASMFFKRSSERPASTFHSYYGNTAGFRGVNDGFHVWNRWLGSDRYSVPDDLDSDTRKDMRRFFAAWSKAFGRPLLNKNNRNTLCMALLASVLETAVFIVVTREPVYAAQSLLLARKHIQGDASVGWGLGARRSRSAPQTSPLEDVAEQLRFVYERQHEQLDSVPPERVVHVCYEDFCREPGRVVAQVTGILRACSPNSSPPDLPSHITLPPFANANTMKLPKSRFDELSALLQDVPKSVAY